MIERMRMIMKGRAIMRVRVRKSGRLRSRESRRGKRKGSGIKMIAISLPLGYLRIQNS